MQPLYGAIEAGGTKFICAVGRAPDEILRECVIPTTQPVPTMQKVVEFLRAAELEHGALSGIGIAAFGPLQLHRNAPNWGRLLRTPKPGWSDASLVDALHTRWSGCRIDIDTDVNAAALAEALLGTSQHVHTLAYVTVGTGIGVGAIVNGERLRGWMHPEMGHIYVRRHARDAAFQGICPFHADCLEGLASGRAIQHRWGEDLSQLSAEHEAYPIIGSYLGQLAGTIALTLSAERIVFGGGVMSNGLLLPHVRSAMRQMLGGYIAPREPEGVIEDVLLHSPLQGRAGLLGAFLLAQRATLPLAVEGKASSAHSL